MNKFSLYLLVVVVAISTSDGRTQVSGFDQVGTTSLQFLKVIPNARAAAMGDASTAIIEASDAVFFNPAALTNVNHFDLSLSYLDYFLDVKISSVSLAYRLSTIGTVGFHVLITDLGEIEETRVDQLLRDEETGFYNPGLTGNRIGASSLSFGLSFAKSLTDKFSFGVTAKLAREDLVARSINALIFDGGITYRTGFKTLTLGMMLRNFGAEIKYFNESYPLPQTFTIGVSGYLFGPQNAFLFHTETHGLLLAYDLSQTRDHSQQQHVGVEYSLTDFLSLRGGYKINFDEEGLTLGLGVKVNRFRLDYSYNDFGEFLDDIQRFSFNFALN